MRYLCFLSILVATPAWATWPDDIVVSNMLSYNGNAVAPATARDQLVELSKDLSVMMANKPISPARTLGSSGFDLTFGITTSMVGRSHTDSAGNPTGWGLAQTPESDGSLVALPTLAIRKGFPASIEVGGRFSWLAGSRQGVVSAFVRGAPIEGYDPIPDVSVQAGYSAYIGNPELHLGVVDLTATVGGQISVGVVPGIRQAKLHPFAGGGLLVMHGRTTLNDYQANRLYEGLVTDDGLIIEDMTLGSRPQVHLGAELQGSDATVRTSLTWSPQSMAAFHSSVGIEF